ncbi:MAG: hypothetical protein JXR96_08380 [Deltaproteobacteria bacterium]|nr:hypothetical protein [Deltaproteobacteria bacterium]
MKKLCIVLTVLAALGLVLGCGSSKNDCEKAGDVMTSGMDEFCSGAAADCQYCECYNQGKIVNSTGDGCDDPPAPGDPVACEGEYLTSAQACLANEAACKASGSDLMKMVCQGEHVGDECEEDADCLFDMECQDMVGCMIPM